MKKYTDMHISVCNKSYKDYRFFFSSLKPAEDV